jgi:hypothetical protein
MREEPRLGFKRLSDLVGQLPQSYQDAYQRGESLAPEKLEPLPPGIQKNIQNLYSGMTASVQRFFDYTLAMEEQGLPVNGDIIALTEKMITLTEELRLLVSG